MATPAYSESDRETEVLKIPPHNIEAEQAVLGGLFLDPEAFFKVMERLRDEDFYRRDHQLIFNAIGGLDADGKPFDVVTTAEWLESHQQLDEAGGLAYLAALAENTPSASNIVAYADIVRKHIHWLVVVAHWQSTGSSSQKPWVQFLATDSFSFSLFTSYN